jgi:hypothetical protein
MNVRFSEGRDKLNAALAAAQAAMSPALKDAKNPHFRSSYATVSAVLEAVLTAYNDNGLNVSQHAGWDDGLVTLTTVVGHTSGQWMESTCCAPLGGRKDAQAVGSAITYLRRYALQSIAGLPVNDDDGNAASRSPAPQAPQAPQARTRKSIVPKVPKLLGPKELEYRLLQNELTLADLEDWCAAHQQPDPSTLNAARQAQLLAWLDNAGASKVHDWWDQKRKAMNAGPDEGDGENRD